MTDDRLTALEERIAELTAAGGASITVQDPRVNNLTRWIATLMGSIALLVMVWVASSINKLNETMSRVVTQNEFVLHTLEQHAQEIRSLRESRRGP